MSNIDDLRAENDSYHQQMQELNEEMERLRLKRDKKNIKSVAVEHKPMELRQAIFRNEQLRKERLKWVSEVNHSDTAARISSTKNEIAVVERKIASCKDEIRGLENTRKNQQPVVNDARHAKDELQYLHAQHRKEVGEFRENWRAINEDNKHSQRILSGLQNKYHEASQKNQLGLHYDEVSTLRETVASQDKEIEELHAEIDALQHQHHSTRKQNHKEIDTYGRHKKLLMHELETAKATLHNREHELKLSYANHKRV